jgi:hypothetical protein
MDDEDFDPLDLRDIQHAKAAVYYIEVQFLGGLSASLIDQIAFREPPDSTLRALLRERGIRWLELPKR